MMIQCPKCGFTQPQDEFCANCGVNLVKARKKQKNLFDLITDSILFHIVLFFSVIIFIFLFLKSNTKKQNPELYETQSTTIQRIKPLNAELDKTEVTQIHKLKPQTEIIENKVTESNIASQNIEEVKTVKDKNSVKSKNSPLKSISIMLAVVAESDLKEFSVLAIGKEQRNSIIILSFDQNVNEITQNELSQLSTFTPMNEKGKIDDNEPLVTWKIGEFIEDSDTLKKPESQSEGLYIQFKKEKNTLHLDINSRIKNQESLSQSNMVTNFELKSNQIGFYELKISKKPLSKKSLLHQTLGTLEILHNQDFMDSNLKLYLIFTPL